MPFRATWVATDDASAHVVPPSVLAMTVMKPAAKQVLAAGQLMPRNGTIGPDVRIVQAPPTAGLVTMLPQAPTATQGLPGSQETAIKPALAGFCVAQVVPPSVVLTATLAATPVLPLPTATQLPMSGQLIAIRPSLLPEKSDVDQLTPPFVVLRMALYAAPVRLPATASHTVS